MDQVFSRFLKNAADEAAEIARASGVVRILTSAAAPSAFLCEFDVPYLCRCPSGMVEVRPGPVRAAIRFPADYLRSSDPHLCLHVVAVLTPGLVHPAVLGPAVCLGSAFRPGTRLGLLIRELFEIFTYANFSLVEGNSLNPEACRLLRADPGLIDSLPPTRLFPRTHSVRVRVREA